MKKLILNCVLLAIMSLSSRTLLADLPPAYEGHRLFTAYCQICHGPGGKGDGPLSIKLNIKPANLTTTIRSRSDQILKKIISGEGRQTITGRDRHNLISDAMPGWKEILSSAQIDALIAYLRFLGTSKHQLMGDPRQGLVLYKEYCQICHGEEGEGDGVMTRMLKIYPRDHSNSILMARVTNEEIVESILDGKNEYMPAWRSILTDEEIAALVSYIRLLAQ